MKIMWLCNTPLPEMYRSVGMKYGNENWLVGISDELRRQEGIEFYYVFPQMRTQYTMRATINNISFWGYYNYSKHGSPYITDKRNEENLEKIIRQINPDIVHIFGTEMHHTIECINAVSDSQSIVVSIQGLVSECAKHYLDGISLKDALAVKIGRCGWDSSLRKKYQFYRRGLNEKEALRKVKYVIGRTEWDKACVKRINPSCKYYYCSETLRSIFYEGQWNIHNVERHSVFVSQGSYEIKGLHTLLYALPDIRKRFPDTKVYVAGNDTFLKETAYGKYIRKIIKREKLDKAVKFVGFLNEKDMYRMLHKAHVMVMPSNCENSPNSVGEAMLVGLPVVASNVGGVSSIAHNGRDAVLFKSCDYTGLARSVCAVFGNNKLAVMMSDNGKITAEKLYSRKNNMTQLLEIYQDICKRSQKKKYSL
ncbi:MAG: glycosyltransferase family 4 protein [Lachnospiraceae bacterium]|nr:glycosyltransferase family 4 protein [Lachnospiraceae bacterium]